ncbi:MAG: Verru Chthon cassette protein [Verrucomicrobiaceae bacterium]|nr:Verru Chthon cassette protein [Verrucomicrobiaceae bacterium]
MQHRPLSCYPLPCRAGYTLVEMLFVLSLMIMLFVVAANGAKKSWQSQELKASAIHLSHDLALASQTAQKLNKPVVVRLYKYYSTSIASDQPHLHAYQLFVHSPTPATGQSNANAAAVPKSPYKPLFEVQTLEGTSLISENSRFTTIIDHLPPSQGLDQNVGIGNYQYVAIEFHPDGSTNLPGNKGPMTITFIPARAADTFGELPKEFYTLVIHPENGTVTMY